MEIRASYVIVGAVVLALFAGLAAFSLWLVEAGIDRNPARYEIAFPGPGGGGTQESARLDPDAAEPPLIPSRRSSLERVFESTPELLAQVLAVVDRLSLLLTDENLEALAGTLHNVERLTAALADRSGGVDAVLTGAAGMTEEVQKTSVEVR